MPFAGEMITALSLPGEVQSFNNGTNSITSLTWAVMPTATADATITNPSNSYNLKVLVLFAGQFVANGQGIQACIAASGGINISPGPGNGGASGNGEIPSIPSQGNGNAFPFSNHVTFSIPPAASAVTFSWYGMVLGAGGTTESIKNITTRVIPLYYY
jgi:hypothetical protein